MKTKVSVRGQVSIPAQIRRELNIKPNSEIEWIEQKGRVVLLPVPENPIKAFRGKGKKKYSTADLMSDRKQERENEEKR